jgi:hypothetical protein
VKELPGERVDGPSAMLADHILGVQKWFEALMEEALVG